MPEIQNKLTPTPSVNVQVYFLVSQLKITSFQLPEKTKRNNIYTAKVNKKSTKMDVLTSMCCPTEAESTLSQF